MTFNQIRKLKHGQRVYWVPEGESKKAFGTIFRDTFAGVHMMFVEWDDRVSDIPCRTYCAEENADSLIHLRKA